MLTRLGSKSGIAKKVEALFPPHRVYIEPFFGSGGLFFNKKKAEENIINDLDEDVISLFRLIRDEPGLLDRELRRLPIHQEILNMWRKNPPTDNIEKILFLLLRSNFTFRGLGMSILNVDVGIKSAFLKKMPKLATMLERVHIENKDANVFLESLDSALNDFDVFFYCDPPYPGTANVYIDKYTIEDYSTLVKKLKTKFPYAKYAFSAYRSQGIEEMASTQGLQVHSVSKVYRMRFASQVEEVLITNYSPNVREIQQGLF